MATSNEAKQDLIQHITFPIPSLKDVPKPGSLGKEQRLETIIANLDKQHQTTRLKIIEAAKRKLQEHHASKQEDDPDKMDISPPAGSDGMEVFLSNLNTPYLDSMGDPCSTPSTAHLMEGMSVGVPQKLPPIEIQLAKETLDQIALYDIHALPARKFYADALSRSRGESSGNGGGAATVTDPRRSSTGGGGAASDPRRLSSVGGPTSAPPSRAGSGTFATTSGRTDPRFANDPRLRGR